MGRLRCSQASRCYNPAADQKSAKEKASVTKIVSCFVSVAALIALRAPTLVTLTAGVLLGGLAAALAQPELLAKLAGESGALGMFKVITFSMSMSLGLTNEAELSQVLASSEAFQSLSADDRAALIKMLYGKLLTGKGMAGKQGAVANPA